MKRQVVDLIGNTPLIKLKKASEETGCICLVVYSGSLQFKGLLGSILNLTKF